MPFERTVSGEAPRQSLPIVSETIHTTTQQPQRQTVLESQPHRQPILESQPRQSGLESQPVYYSNVPRQTVVESRPVTYHQVPPPQTVRPATYAISQPVRETVIEQQPVLQNQQVFP